jgi:hypothetical protein
MYQFTIRMILYVMTVTAIVMGITIKYGQAEGTLALLAASVVTYLYGERKGKRNAARLGIVFFIVYCLLSLIDFAPRR